MNSVCCVAFLCFTFFSFLLSLWLGMKHHTFPRSSKSLNIWTWTWAYSRVLWVCAFCAWCLRSFRPDDQILQAWGSPPLVLTPLLPWRNIRLGVFSGPGDFPPAVAGGTLKLQTAVFYYWEYSNSFSLVANCNWKISAFPLKHMICSTAD